MKREINNVGILVQMLLFASAALMAIISFFIEELFTSFTMIMCVLLYVLSYNNYTVYKKKYMTMIYFIAASLIIVSYIVGAFYGF